ncbi:MAG: Divergent domain protein [Verrucomicrobiales bacterium]|nr:Divergent domain protein [Verrucomicrobiales bacterium]
MILAPSPYAIPAPKKRLDWLRGFKNRKVPEDSALDYKSGDSLNNMFDDHFTSHQPRCNCTCRECARKSPDKYRAELTKDVSAFANSGGGLLIYGIEEDTKTHLPERWRPVAEEINHEDISRIINASIRPKIEGCQIAVIKLTKKESPAGGCCIAIEIPQSSTAHQAKDKSYYRRYLTESKIMEDHEIRDVMNRMKHPDVGCEVSIRFQRHVATQRIARGDICVRVFNSDLSVFCKNFYCRLIGPWRTSNLTPHDCIEYDDSEQRITTPKGQGIELKFEGINLYPGSEQEKTFAFKISDSHDLAEWVGRFAPPESSEMLTDKMLVQIFADGMQPKAEWVSVEKARSQWKKQREIKLDYLDDEL